MNKNEAEEFIYRSYLKAQDHQDFNAKDAAKRRPDLTRDLIRSKSGTPCVVITGSKGKGSAACMIARILETKYKVGLMTSPHIIDICERFKINGVNVSDADFAGYMTAIEPEIDEIESRIPENVCISPMGIETDFALTYFNDNKTEFNVFECGKGARYDDVNNIPHPYAVINKIFLEHTRELGDTLEAIADDKSYVITEGQKCVFTAAQTEGVMRVLKKRAELLHVPLKVYGEDYRAENIRYTRRGMRFDVEIGGEKYRDLSIPLMGKHQAENCALAMAFAKEVLGELDMDLIKPRLAGLTWPGRMEVLSEDPFIMLDACVNPASCGNVLDVLGQMGIDRITLVVGIPDDKDYAGVVREMLPLAETVILTRSKSPHYVFTNGQCRVLAEQGMTAEWTHSVGEAIEAAKKRSLPIVILGTTSVVADVKEWACGRRLL